MHLVKAYSLCRSTRVPKRWDMLFRGLVLQPNVVESSKESSVSKLNFRVDTAPNYKNNQSFRYPPGLSSSISSYTISSFLANVGQHPVQNQDKYFLVKCPNCGNDSSVSSTKSFVKPGSGSFYCTSCTRKSTWSQFMEKTVEVASKNVITPTVLNQLGQPCVPGLSSLELESLSYSNLMNNKILVSDKQLDQVGHGLFTMKTLEDYWVSNYLVARPVEPKLNLFKTSLSTQPIQSLAFPRTNSDPNSPGKFRISSLKAVSLPGPELVKFEPTGQAAEPGLFGFHLIDENCDAIALTPTEFDAMAIYQNTGVPAVSLPRAHNQLGIDCMPLLARFNKIFLWFANDLQGQNLAQLFAKKLGLDRCHIVNNMSEAGTKVLCAYDALKKKCNLSYMLHQSKLHTHSKVMGYNGLRDSILLEILHADQVKGVPTQSLPTFNSIIKGLRPGELTIFTGPTGSGKTTFLSQLSLDYAMSGVSTLWGSFEIPNSRLAKRMLFQFANKTIQPELEDFNFWSEKFAQLPLYFMKFFGTTNIEDVIEAMEHAIHAYDVQHVLIDNLQFMTSGLGKGFERFEIQDEALSMFRKFATQHNIHVSLVVHPRKDDRALLDLNSIFGSAKMTQEADNVIIIQQAINEYRYIDIKKNRFDGAVGFIPIRFERETFKSVELDEQERKELSKLLKGELTC